MLDRMRAARGVVRSLRIYYGGRHRRAALDAIYSRFVTSGDLVFDIGAHVGDRVAAFRRLGARVVVAEPQPALATTLRLLYGRDREVTRRGGRRSGAAAGTLALQDQSRQPDGVDRVRRLRRRARTARPAGKARAGRARSRCR